MTQQLKPFTSIHSVFSVQVVTLTGGGLPYPVKTHVYFDGTDVVLLSRNPLSFGDIRFLIWDIREMRNVPMYLSYVQVLQSFMESYFGNAGQWRLRPSVDALRSTYEHIIEVEAAFFEQFGVRL